MSPIDERLKSLNIVLPDVMPPVVHGYVQECKMQEYQGGCHCGALGIIYRTDIDPMYWRLRHDGCSFVGAMAWLAHRTRRAIFPSTSRIPPRFGTIVSRIGPRIS
jgi:hypothetical protein